MNCPTCGSADPAVKLCSDVRAMPHVPNGDWCTPCTSDYHMQVLDSEAREQIIPKEH